MSAFKDTKLNARRKKVTEAKRKAAKKNRILEGFQCPHKRCMHILPLADFILAPAEHVCGRCGASVEEFTPIFVDLRRITPKNILKHDQDPPP
jgi:transcription initiation factor IIE alpha subunit